MLKRCTNCGFEFRSFYSGAALVVGCEESCPSCHGMVSTHIVSNGLDLEKLNCFRIASNDVSPYRQWDGIASSVLLDFPLNRQGYLANHYIQKYMDSIKFANDEITRLEEGSVEVLRDGISMLIKKSCDDFEYFTESMLIYHGGEKIKSGIVRRRGYRVFPYPEIAKSWFCINFGDSFSGLFDVDLDYLDDYFELRHVLTHNGGIVDEKFVTNTEGRFESLGAQLGNPIPVNVKILNYGINAMMLVCVGVTTKLANIRIGVGVEN